MKKMRPILWIVAALICIGMISCTNQHLDDLSAKVSESESFIKWYELLFHGSKENRTADLRKRVPDSRFQKAGFQMIVDIYLKNSFAGNDSLFESMIAQPPSIDRATVIKAMVLLKKVQTEFPELKKLSAEEQELVFKKAMEKRKAINP
jgi:hypothetical protein